MILYLDTEVKWMVKVMQLLIDIREKARTNKDFKLSDQIRNALNELNIN